MFSESDSLGDYFGKSPMIDSLQNTLAVMFVCIDSISLAIAAVVQNVLEL